MLGITSFTKQGYCCKTYTVSLSLKEQWQRTIISNAPGKPFGKTNKQFQLFKERTSLAGGVWNYKDHPYSATGRRGGNDNHQDYNKGLRNRAEITICLGKKGERKNYKYNTKFYNYYQELK